MTQNIDHYVDRVVATGAWFIAWIIKGLPPYERDFDRKDPLIDHKHHKSQCEGIPLFSVSSCPDYALLLGLAGT